MLGSISNCVQVRTHVVEATAARQRWLCKMLSRSLSRSLQATAYRSLPSSAQLAHNSSCSCFNMSKGSYLLLAPSDPALCVPSTANQQAAGGALRCLHCHATLYMHAQNCHSLCCQVCSASRTSSGDSRHGLPGRRTAWRCGSNSAAALRGRLFRCEREANIRGALLIAGRWHMCAHARRPIAGVILLGIEKALFGLVSIRGRMRCSKAAEEQLQHFMTHCTTFRTPTGSAGAFVVSGSRTARLRHLLLGRLASLSLDLRLRVKVTCAVMSAFQGKGHAAHGGVTWRQWRPVVSPGERGALLAAGRGDGGSRGQQRPFVGGGGLRDASGGQAGCLCSWCSCRIPQSIPGALLAAWSCRSLYDHRRTLSERLGMRRKERLPHDQALARRGSSV